jgi:hypothetical protein
VLHPVEPGLDGGDDAIPSVGVRGDRQPLPVRLVRRRAKLVRAELACSEHIRRGATGHMATGSHDLDHGRAAVRVIADRVLRRPAPDRRTIRQVIDTSILTRQSYEI